MNYPLKLDENNHRFEFDLGGDIALIDYMNMGDRWVLTHTFVPPNHEGQGIGSQLVKSTLDFLRDKDIKIIPACPFVANYIKLHPEYNSML